MEINNFVRITSISDLHNLLGLEKPKHSKITVIEYASVKLSEKMAKSRIVNELYNISMKNNELSNLNYGRNHYSMKKGGLIFSAPNQVFTIKKEDLNKRISGKGIYFHPDLLNGSHLSKTILNYSFFDYYSNESLEVGEMDKKVIDNIFTNIQTETMNLDEFNATSIIIANLELLFKYSERFFEKNIKNGKRITHEVIASFEKLLSDFFNRNLHLNSGLVEVDYFARKLNLSRNYLSDLVKKHTGKGVQEHINIYLVKRAKMELLITNKPVSKIANDLGFKYPQYFSRLFKQRVGISPSEFRNNSD